MLARSRSAVADRSGTATGISSLVPDGTSVIGAGRAAPGSAAIGGSGPSGGATVELGLSIVDITGAPPGLGPTTGGIDALGVRSVILSSGGSDAGRCCWAAGCWCSPVGCTKPRSRRRTSVTCEPKSCGVRRSSDAAERRRDLAEDLLRRLELLPGRRRAGRPSAAPPRSGYSRVSSSNVDVRRGSACSRTARESHSRGGSSASSSSSSCSTGGASCRSLSSPITQPSSRASM